MRILHLADIHLDRPFVGLSRDAAQERRRDLHDALRRCLQAAKDRGVDLVTIGGDLWEDENVSPDTRNSVAHELGGLDIPVVIVAGNHDPLLRGGNYLRAAWPDNVTVVDSASPVEFSADGEVSLWCASWTERPLTSGFLAELRAPKDRRTHVLMIHGTARGSGLPTDGGHCPFDPADVSAAGFAMTLAGHIHSASYERDVVYPGSPEPLGPAETGRHCYALIDIGGAGSHVEFVDVNARRYADLVVDCSDAESSAEVEQRLTKALGTNADPGLLLRARLRGEVAAECAIDPAALTMRHGGGFAALTVRDETSPAIEYQALAGRKTADGIFVSDLLERLGRAEDDRERAVLERALEAGVRAMSGRKDVLRVD